MLAKGRKAATDACVDHRMKPDSVSLFENYAHEFMAARDGSCVGARLAEQWAALMPPGTEVLEVGCGAGLPVTRALDRGGVKIWAIDSSPTLLKTFSKRFPSIPVDCAHALKSDYFGKKFGAVISVGLIFLLRADEQAALFHRVSNHLQSGGRFLFTAPLEKGEWRDLTTEHKCLSLGEAWYEDKLGEAGFKLTALHKDEGNNNYYETERIAAR